MGVFPNARRWLGGTTGANDIVLRRRCDQAVYEMRNALADEAKHLSEEAEKADNRKA